jgi:predicted DNA-binding protein YlxM (UPF0122 family)
MLSDLRLQQLADNIRKDTDLLKEYEDILRFEDDPIRIAKYNHMIERLRNSVKNYTKEYDDLQKQAMGTSSEGMETVAKISSPQNIEIPSN